MPKGAPNTCCMSRKYIRAYFHRQSISQAGYQGYRGSHIGGNHGHLTPVPYAVRKYRVSANQEPDVKDLSSSSRRESEHSDPDIEEPSTRATSLASSGATTVLSQFSVDFDQNNSQNTRRKLSTVSVKFDRTTGSDSRISSKKRNSLQFVPLRKLSLNHRSNTEQNDCKLWETHGFSGLKFPDDSISDESATMHSNREQLHNL